MMQFFLAALCHLLILLLHSCHEIHGITLPSVSVSSAASAAPSLWRMMHMRGGNETRSELDLLTEPDTISEDEGEVKDVSSSSVEITGSPEGRKFIDGVYHQTEWNINDKPHYEKYIQKDMVVDNSSGYRENSKVHLYWSGTQWILHFDLDPSRNFQNLLAYAKSKSFDPKHTTSYWFVKSANGKSYEPSPLLTVSLPGSKKNPSSPSSVSIDSHQKAAELMGVPSNLLPFYVAFMFDAFAVGLVMPLLPFYVMQLGANAFQLSLVVSANYVAQTIGVLVMGKVSDLYGRKLVALCCLAASSLSYFGISQSSRILFVALSRMISGSFGGLIPVMQSCVADSSRQIDRPKYLGRISATFGLGFVLGPLLNKFLPATMRSKDKIALASILPIFGFFSVLIFAKEPKSSTKHMFLNRNANKKNRVGMTIPTVHVKEIERPPIRIETMLLVLNGFLIMYAFATESIYAMFMKDAFGYEERALSELFAVNGLLIGLFQVFLIKPMIMLCGKHVSLVIGNVVLGLGMFGFAMLRRQSVHFTLFAIHMIGYSMADTSLVSLVTRYSSTATQGRDLSLNQAAQSVAKVISPLVAGALYEIGKNYKDVLPEGALPFVIGSLCPMIAVGVPSVLYIWSISRKRKSNSDREYFENEQKKRIAFERKREEEMKRRRKETDERELEKEGKGEQRRQNP